MKTFVTKSGDPQYFRWGDTPNIQNQNDPQLITLGINLGKQLILEQTSKDNWNLKRTKRFVCKPHYFCD